MGLFGNSKYTIPIVINDIINGIPVRRSSMYHGMIVDTNNTGVKTIKIKGWKGNNFILPNSSEWVMTVSGRGLEINMYNPDHYTYVKQTVMDDELMKVEIDQESIGLAIMLDDVLKKYEERKWWDTDIFRTASVLVIFLLIIMVSLFYMGQLTDKYVETVANMDTKKHIEEMAWINATTNIQKALEYNLNIVPEESE